MNSGSAAMPKGDGLAFIEGEWRRYRDSAYCDDWAYADIIEGIRRQGFLDALGDDLIPAAYDNGQWEHSTTAGLMRTPTGQRQADMQARYDDAQRQRQRQRERQADLEWRAEQTRREWKKSVRRDDGSAATPRGTAVGARAGSGA